MLRDCSDIFKLIEACMEEAREKMRDVEPLHARIAELEAENGTLRKALQNSLGMIDLMVAAGVIPEIVRSDPCFVDARAALKGEKG